ncbi:MAG: NAD(P)/FAD-dependent oxidoreductase [Candidatus Omnitrophica bacterium]|nr:NAD(P)/FAD-dependent oxidoreductase [Candidatus Omnitrophota bacterium]
MSVNIPVSANPRVVIVGAGFAGLELAKALKAQPVQVVLVDKNNYHTFQPLLYQVATAGLEPDSITYPIREIFRSQKNFIFRMAEVLEVRAADRCVVTSIGEIAYDHLVIATGAKSAYFGLSDFEERALSMKTVPEAVELRNIILENFERAVLTTDLVRRDSLMTFVIIGGGPTGVELAGALGELKKVVLPHDHPELDLTKMMIYLVDMESRLLKTMSPAASRSAEQFLRKHGVDVWLGSRVRSYDGQMIVFADGKSLVTSNVIWTAGVTGAVLPGLPPEVLSAGRIRTDSFSRVAGCSNIFAIGDVAAVVTEDTPHGHPMLAPVAIQQAKLLAVNLARLLKGNSELKSFVYRDMGVMATVGRHEAVADLSFGKFQGPLAWFLWAALHLMTLVGFRNRLVALVNWTWSYFRYDSGLRLIIRAKDRCAVVKSSQ